MLGTPSRTSRRSYAGRLDATRDATRCSGDIYAAVPMITPIWVAAAVSVGDCAPAEMPRLLAQQLEKIAVFERERAPGARWNPGAETLDVVVDDEQSGIGIRQQAEPDIR